MWCWFVWMYCAQIRRIGMESMTKSLANKISLLCLCANSSVEQTKHTHTQTTTHLHMTKWHNFKVENGCIVHRWKGLDSYNTHIFSSLFLTNMTCNAIYENDSQVDRSKVDVKGVYLNLPKIVWNKTSNPHFDLNTSTIFHLNWWAYEYLLCEIVVVVLWHVHKMSTPWNCITK